MVRVSRVQAKEAYGAVGRSDWLDVDWEAHRRWVEVDGRWVNLIDIGEGPAVIFIHGLAGCWQNWLENLPFFARNHRVIAVDLPGFGESEMPAETITISNYARIVDAVLDAIDVDSGVIVGNSMGGFIGAEMAIHFPARVERLCLVGAAGLSIENLRTQRKRGLRHRAENVVFFNLAWIATRSPALTARPHLRRLILMLVAAHPERLPGPLTAELVRGAGKDGFSPALDALCSYPIRDRLGEIACPTLIVWGDKDLLVPVKDAAEFERLIPDSRKVIYTDTGHVPMLERPARFNSDLRAFLEESPGEEAPTADRRTFAG
jgi:pimeloyl-ACP methyl ester carboxylesterase